MGLFMKAFLSFRYFQAGAVLGHCPRLTKHLCLASRGTFSGGPQMLCPVGNGAEPRWPVLGAGATPG